MNRLLFATILLVTATIASDASADHLDRLRREYELNRTELRNDYLARREALRFMYNRERDGLLLERKRAYRIDCHDTRATRVRAINRALGDLARENGVRHRDLSRWFANENRNLHREYEFARTNLRRIATRPVIVDSRFHAHPADCSCSVCAPPPPVVPVNPGCSLDRPAIHRPVIDRPIHRPVRPVIGNSGYGVYDDFGFGPANYYEDYREASRPSKGLAIASLILGMLSN